MLFQFSSIKKKHDRSQKIINEFTDEIIKTKIVELNNSGSENGVNADDDDIGQNTKTLTQIFLENSHENMTLEQIRDELVTVMIGEYLYITPVSSSPKFGLRYCAIVLGTMCITLSYNQSRI